MEILSFDQQFSHYLIQNRLDKNNMKSINILFFIIQGTKIGFEQEQCKGLSKLHWSYWHIVWLNELGHNCFR